MFMFSFLAGLYSQSRPQPRTTTLHSPAELVPFHTAPHSLLLSTGLNVRQQRHDAFRSNFLLGHHGWHNDVNHHHHCGMRGRSGTRGRGNSSIVDAGQEAASALRMVMWGGLHGHHHFFLSWLCNLDVPGSNRELPVVRLQRSMIKRLT